MNLREATQPQTWRGSTVNTVGEDEADSGSDDLHGYGDGLVRRFVVDVDQNTARADIDGVRDNIALLPAEHHGRRYLVRFFNRLERFIAVDKVDRAQRTVGILLGKAHPFAVCLILGRARGARQVWDSQRARWPAWVRVRGAGQEW